ncbi:HAD family hydrolase [Paenibacillus dokdonensis]|uniref:HAD family hydrolase n=1 Tax=Paenibacillus dokdonensis TaxID=2567944 RepID=UPI0010A7F7BB|nr:HAD family hydrolase [Paenibacillus dokdonensis]
MKSNMKYIFFDCMETLVDLYELPSDHDYALWAFNGSGVEHYWKDFDEFLKRYNESKIEIASILDPNEEYEMIRRFEFVVERTDNIDIHLKNDVATNLYDTYWSTYKSKCFIKQEKLGILLDLAKKYKLAVVSNFKIRDGIEELLRLNGASNLFEFVITSINTGWRKPSPKIFELAIQYADCASDQIIFVGDDYENDYLAPKRMNMMSILLDKETNNIDYESEVRKVKNFTELKSFLLG